ALFMIVPDFTVLVLGDKWLPMVTVFRLLIVYSLLDPLFVISTHLTTALGEPEVLTRIKLMQLVVFVPAVMLFGRLWQIEGVALAADLMLVVGMGAVFRAVRRSLPVATGRILWPPLLAAVIAGLVTTVVFQQFMSGSVLWLQMGLKGIVSVVIFGLILFLLERHEMIRNFTLLRHYLLSGRVRPGT
ncbi:MAG: polysaccharide biosynthesis C-terminal domain-containing protein, partial [Anaerolineales bacterium]|nr:polysaccharide biosynthesis C-terminal domain-containing protein [Anaerolineales bacterium]